MTGFATSPGIPIRLDGFGMGSLSYGYNEYDFPFQAFADRQTWNPPPCGGPQIHSLQIYPSGSFLPQPTNGLMVGTNGILEITASCLHAVAGITVSTIDPTSDNGPDPGITLGPAFLSNGGTSVSATYTVAGSALSGQRIVTLLDSGGSATASLEVVSDYPFVDSVVPSTWEPSKTIAVKISGAFFGGGTLFGTSGTVAMVPANGLYPVTFSPQSWSDRLITGYVTTTAGDPGQVVTVAVTGGNYGFGFQPNQGAGRAGGNTAVIVPPGPCFNALDTIIAEYKNPLYGIDFVPVCNDFTQVSPSSRFPFRPASGQIGYLNWGDNPFWAILTPYFGANLDYLAASGPPFDLAVTSAYRNPRKNWEISRSVNGPHTHGNAVDLDAKHDDQKWIQLRTFIRNATGVVGSGACIEPLIQSSNSHVHVDWRPLAKCNPDWLQ